MTKQEILELIKEAKELGLKSLEVEGVKVEFNSQTNSTPNKGDITPQDELEAKDLVAPPNPFDELTEEEILFWSCDHGVDLAAQKIKDHMDKLQRKQEDDDRETRSGV